jgi:outer membrane protein OmpA-like peptidoglycan-associated protein
MKTAILTSLLLTLAVSGCQSNRPNLAKDAGTEQGDKFVFMERSISQARDMDTGEAFHVICDSPCPKPTAKTQYRPPASVVRAFEPPPRLTAPPVPVVVQVPSVAPDPALVSMTQHSVHFASFALARSELSREELASLDTFLSSKKATGMWVHVRGRTDITGTVAVNRRLARARAARIQDVLIQSGVTADRITTSHCIDCFSTTNETEEGRAENRRAIVLLAPTREALASVDLDCHPRCHADAVQIATMKY